jgi:hypothetical protein
MEENKTENKSTKRRPKKPKDIVCKCGKPSLKWSSLCNDCLYEKRKKREEGNEKFWNRKHGPEAKQTRRDKYHILRKTAFDILGGYKCNLCGFDDPRALQIDHINNDGHEKRQGYRESGEILYNKIIETNGAGFQVLCANCNWIKKAEYNGYTLDYYKTEHVVENKSNRTKFEPEDTFDLFDGYETMASICKRMKMSTRTLHIWWSEKFGEDAVYERFDRIQREAASIAGRKRKLKALPFEAARKFAQSLCLKSRKQWKEYCKSGNKPDNMPYNPDTRYKNEGWIDFKDWLGCKTASIKCKNFISFEEARNFAHSLNLNEYRDWLLFCKSGNRPKNIPANPRNIYKDKGWISFSDWIGK